MTSSAIELQNSEGIGDAAGGALFAALEKAHREAMHARPNEVVTAHLVLAGEQARATTVGRRLAAVYGKALRHLTQADGAGTVSLAIDLWDESATGIPCPDVVREIDKRVRKEEDAVVTVGAATDRYVGHLRPGLCFWIDRLTSHIVGCASSSGRLSVQDRGKPLHVPLLLWHADRGVPVIHAALVSLSGRGILFVGKGGTGKTTAALACRLGGFDFLADDYVGLEQVGVKRFVGHSLYDSAWLTPGGESRFPGLVPLASEPLAAEEKRLVSVSDVAPGALRSSTEVCAIVVTTLCGEAASSVRPISKAEALLAAAPTSMLRLPVSGTAHLDRLSRLIECVPTRELAVGQDVSTVAPRMRELLEREKRS